LSSSAILLAQSARARKQGKSSPTGYSVLASGLITKEFLIKICDGKSWSTRSKWYCK